MRKLFGPTLLLAAVLLFSPFVRSQEQPERTRAGPEAPQDMLAAQIRLQGFACDRALDAARDDKLSRPDRAVWVLKCNNGTYRISRSGDMAAKVETLPTE